MIGELVLLVGAAFVLLAAVGTLRFSDVFARMHVLSKASTFGLLLILTGGIVELETANDITFLVLAGLLHRHLTRRQQPAGQGDLLRRGHRDGIDTIDELAELRVSEEVQDEQPPGAAGRHGDR